jgi:hypothetical protein
MTSFSSGMGPSEPRLVFLLGGMLRLLLWRARMGISSGCESHGDMGSERDIRCALRRRLAFSVPECIVEAEYVDELSGPKPGLLESVEVRNMVTGLYGSCSSCIERDML